MPYVQFRVLFLWLIVAGLTFLGALQVFQARESARNCPFATYMGHGSANHFTYHFSAGGRPDQLYETMVVERMTSLAASLEQFKIENEGRGLEIHTSLFVHASNLGDECLGPLTQCEVGLEGLVIEDVFLSPANVASISKVASLNSLCVRKTGLTVESLRHLVELPKLRYLDVRDNGFTAESIAGIELTNPDCQIVW